MPFHYACSDLHGQGWAWDGIKSVLNPEDTLFFLGDAIDRGPDGVRIMKELLNRPNTIYLLGNHECMMLESFLLEKKEQKKAQLTWYSNGGEETEKTLIRYGEDEALNLLSMVIDLPVRATYINSDGYTFQMTHAGCDPWDFNEDESENFDNLIWDRTHYFSTFWPDEAEKTIVLHGHTNSYFIIHDWNTFFPKTDIQKKYRYNNSDGVFKYLDGKKISLDTDAAYNGYAALYNLDTMETILIKKP